MDQEQLLTIKRLTGYNYSDIVKMSDIDFWRKITICLAKGSLSPKQHQWLDTQRTGFGMDQGTIDALEIFGGKVIK